MKTYNSKSNDGAIDRDTSRESSMEFNAFMRTLEKERHTNSQNMCSHDMSLDLTDLGPTGQSAPTPNDTFDNKLNLNDLPSESNFGARLMGSFRRRMSSSRRYLQSLRWRSRSPK